MSYRIESESYTYTYRSYMACEDQGPDDCVGYNTRFVVFNGKRRLRNFYTRDLAKEYIQKLKARKRKSK